MRNLLYKLSAVALVAAPCAAARADLVLATPGTVVIGGMTLATVIGILMVPVTFSVVEYLSHRLRGGGGDTTMDSTHPPETTGHRAPALARDAQEGQA